MQRRSLAVEGFVHFPLHQPSTGEGGTLVKLWVIDRRPLGEGYGVCAGVFVSDVVAESFIGTDKSPPPDDPLYEQADQLTPEQLCEADRAYRKAYKAWQNSFYDTETGQVGDLLASIVLGSTGWSGDFLCAHADLTPEGQALYASVAKLYPDAELHLATFLDT